MVFYSLALTLALLLSAPVWGWRMLRQDRYREGLQERLGRVPTALRTAAMDRPVVWVHAVSVGETLAALPLIQALEAALPDHRVVLSTTTPTGQRVARERLGGGTRIFRLPLDFRFAVRAYLHALRPRLLVLMESELWPRLLHECGRAGVPVAVVNARVSDRSLPRYLRLRRLWQPLLRHVSLLLAQSDEDAGRWTRIGVPPDRVMNAGNLKFDTPPPAETPLARTLREHLPPGARLLIAGSTHATEEAAVLRCFAAISMAGRLLLLAPRHPQRASAVAAEVAAAGLRPALLSAWQQSPHPVSPRDVLILDTVGELAALYPLAHCAFIGGSLIPHGGQNPLEAARCGIPVLIGPSFENFRDAVAALEAAGALHIVSADSLCAAIDEGLGQSLPPVEAGTGSFTRHRGATERTVAALLTLLRQPTPEPRA